MESGLIRFRVRQHRQQIGPLHDSDEAAEQAAIDLGLARRDEHYDVLHLGDGVVIDCVESDDSPAKPA